MTTSPPMFAPATKYQTKLRAAFDGISGSGKTFSMMMFLRELVGPEGRIAIIDTEHGAARKYSDTFKFDVCELTDYSIDSYRRAMDAAAKYDAVGIDSLSHAWRDVLEKVDQITARSRGGNAFTSGWRDMSPAHNGFVDALLAHPTHLVCTVRRKADYVMETRDGKQIPKKVGMAMEQRNGLEYEFDVVADFDLDSHITISKHRLQSRLEPYKNAFTWKDIPKFAGICKEWLTDGAPAPAPVEPPPPPTPAPVVRPPPVDLQTAIAAFTERIRATKTTQEASRVALELQKQPEAVRVAMRPIYGPHLEQLKAAEKAKTDATPAAGGKAA